jgi:hypothetical protein
MTPAALDPLAQRVLRALYELAQLDCPVHMGVLAGAVVCAPAELLAALQVLDARGLVSAQRLRLTMQGLAQAARIASLQLHGERFPPSGKPALRRALPCTRPQASRSLFQLPRSAAARARC